MGTEAAKPEAAAQPVSVRAAPAVAAESLIGVTSGRTQRAQRLLSAGPGRLQVGAADDHLETEADALARSVVARLRGSRSAPSAAEDNASDAPFAVRQVCRRATGTEAGAVEPDSTAAPLVQRNGGKTDARTANILNLDAPGMGGAAVAAKSEFPGLGFDDQSGSAPKAKGGATAASAAPAGSRGLAPPPATGKAKRGENAKAPAPAAEAAPPGWAVFDEQKAPAPPGWAVFDDEKAPAPPGRTPFDEEAAPTPGPTPFDEEAEPATARTPFDDADDDDFSAFDPFGIGSKAGQLADGADKLGAVAEKLKNNEGFTGEMAPGVTLEGRPGTSGAVEGGAGFVADAAGAVGSAAGEVAAVPAKLKGYFDAKETELLDALLGSTEEERGKIAAYLRTASRIGDQISETMAAKTKVKKSGSATATASATARNDSSFDFDPTLLEAVKAVLDVGSELNAALEAKGEYEAQRGALKLAVSGRVKMYANLKAEAKGGFSAGARGAAAAVGGTLEAKGGVEAEASVSVAVGEAELKAQVAAFASAGATLKGEAMFELSADGFAIGAQLEAFVGTKAGISGGAQFSYRGQPLLTFTYGLQVSAGLGGNVGGSFSYKNGILTFDATLAAALGLGGGANVGVELDLYLLWEAVTREITLGYARRQAALDARYKTEYTLPVLDPAQADELKASARNEASAVFVDWRGRNKHALPTVAQLNVALAGSNYLRGAAQAYMETDMGIEDAGAEALNSMLGSPRWTLRVMHGEVIGIEDNAEENASDAEQSAKDARSDDAKVRGPQGRSFSGGGKNGLLLGDD